MKKILLVFISIFLCIFAFNNKVSANSSDLDRIDEYYVTVSPNLDGSLHMNIHIKWTVLQLDDDGKGVTWIQVGTPNMYVDNIAVSYNCHIVDDAYYYSADGSHIRLDLIKEYKDNDTFTVDYSYDQSYMYHINENELYYDYVPGWFEDITITKMIIKWKDSLGVELSDNYPGYELIDGYYTQTFNNVRYYNSSSLETYRIRTKYSDMSLFTEGIDPDKTYSERYLTDKEIIIIVCIVVFIILGIIAFIIYAYSQMDPYTRERGFYGRYRPFYFYNYYPRRTGVHRLGHSIEPPTTPGGSSGGGFGGGFSCACACACAGGGRAGCSKKDFYQGKVNLSKLKESLKNE